MLTFIKSSYYFLKEFIYGHKDRQAIAFRRSYKLLSDNIKGIKAYNIIIINNPQLNATSYSYKCPIIYIYNFNTYPSNIFK